MLAAAGSGKTRVLTRRIAWRVNHGTASAPYVLALTFTRKAASELRGRLSSLGLAEPATVGTFHAIALGELRRLAAERGPTAPVVVASKARLLAAAAGPEIGRDRGTAGGPRLRDRVGAGSLPDAARLLRGRGARPGDTAGATRRSSPRSGVATSEKSNAGECSTSTIFLLRCAAELDKDAEFAASARWRFRHVFVDEYQDVNPAQVRLLEAWLGDNDDLCVVGDPDQAIYAWNGSDPRALDRVSPRSIRARASSAWP